MNGPATIEQLKKRFDEFNTQKIQVETKLKSAEQTLNQLKAEAMEEHGSDDMKTLTAKLKTIKKENEAKRAGYEKLLDKIESDLAGIEEKFVGEELE